MESGAEIIVLGICFLNKNFYRNISKEHGDTGAQRKNLYAPVPLCSIILFRVALLEILFVFIAYYLTNLSFLLKYLPNKGWKNLFLPLQKDKAIT